MPHWSHWHWCQDLQDAARFGIIVEVGYSLALGRAAKQGLDELEENVVSTVTVGKLAPPFELISMEGRGYSLQNLQAQGPVLVAFFKVSCPTCQYTFPFLERLYRQLGPNGVQVVGISQDNARDSQKFARQFGVTFPVLIDAEPYAVSRKYGVEFVPTLFLIAPDSQVEVSGDGFSKSDLLAIQESLARHLSTTPPALFRPGEKVPEYKPG